MAATSMSAAISSNGTQPSDLTLTDEQGKNDLAIFPNSIDGSQLEFTVLVNDENDGAIAKVEIVKMTGEVMHAENVAGEGNGNGYHVKCNNVVAPGLYLVTVTKNGKRFKKRLLVK
jgi:hypothetical protein